MKSNNRLRSGWMVLAVIALSVGMIGASERVPPEGPLALLYDQIHALFVETGLLAAESDDQQAQIDHLTGTVCGLSVLHGNPAPPELCEVVATAICECQQKVECVCDPGGSHVELESCESAFFPHPEFGEVPPPQCEIVDGCRGTFTRIAAGDVGSIEVGVGCEPDGGGCSGCTCPDSCPTFCLPGTSDCVPPF